MLKDIIEAAINEEGDYDSFACFFHGNQYIKYNWATDLFESGYPAPLSKWNFPGKCAGGIDAGINGFGSSAGKAYFFREDEYIRYDWAKNAADDKYPQKLSSWNLPEDFANGIDAAVNGKGQYKNKIYLFKGDQYVRYDLLNVTIDIGYPKPLSSWGLPGDFSNGIDATLNGKLLYEGKLYFFKGDRYITYDWATEKPDDTIPKDTSQWKTMFDENLVTSTGNNKSQLVFGGNTTGNNNSI